MLISHYPELWSSPVRRGSGARRRWLLPPVAATRTSWTMAGVGLTGLTIRQIINLAKIMSHIVNYS